MDPQHINPYHLPVPLLRYATGQEHRYPNVVGIPAKTVREMRKQRQAYLRNLLQNNRQAAYNLGDFNELMAEEIWQHAKRTLRPLLFGNWDANLRETRYFATIFMRISGELHREYQEAVEQRRSFIKLRYVTATAQRKAFAEAVKNPQLLGEIELVCLGRLQYGLEPPHGTFFF